MIFFNNWGQFTPMWLETTFEHQSPRDSTRDYISRVVLTCISQIPLSRWMLLYSYLFNLVWHKIPSARHPVRSELIYIGLLVSLVIHNITLGTSKTKLTPSTELIIRWLYLLLRGKTSSKRGVLSMTLNCIWWWDYSSGVLGMMEYPLIGPLLPGLL